MIIYQRLILCIIPALLYIYIYRVLITDIERESAAAEGYRHIRPRAY